jgi:hypothetical protein
MTRRVGLLTWCRVLQLGSLVVAAAAVGVRWASESLHYYVVPPGFVLLAGSAVLLLALGRRPIATAVATLAATVVAYQLLDSGVLDRPSTALVSGALSVQLIAALVAVAAGLVALVALARRQHLRQRNWATAAQVAGLLVLAPVCAEYLSAYDDSTGDPVRLLGNLVVFVPLYGCPALLIRELARRAQLGWLGMVLLAAAFGLMQAGVVDQSLFSTDYRQIEGWDESYRATLIAPLGVSAFNLVNFVGGHIVFSICAPIALVEGARPARAEVPWLGRTALGVVAALYVGASALVLDMSLTTEESHASAVQVVASLLVVAALVLAAVRLGRRPHPTVERPAPRARAVFAVVLVLALVHGFAEETWTGVVMAGGALVAAAVLLLHWSRLRGWGAGHVVAAAAPPLLVRALSAFTYDPLVGEVSEVAKYGHNVVMLAIVLAAIVLTRQRSRREVDHVASPR